MEFNSYQQFWNNQARTPESAMFAVDGSTDEAIVRRTGRYAARQMSAALDLQPDDRVLELGCGLGRIGRELAPSCAHWTGVDISGEMIRFARQRLSGFDNVSFHQLERSSLAMFDDNSFDKAYSLAVLCHMDKEDLFLYLEELRRVLKPGGMLYADTWNLANPTGWKRWMYEVRFWQQSSQAQRKDIARNQFCSPDELGLYARQAGLDVLACFDDSHWLQLVAGKDLADREAAADRLADVRDAVVYSPLFVDFFEKTCEVIYGETHPREIIAYMDRHEGSTEHELFRPFIRGLWTSQARHWGQPDD
jgi:SAM-dependent methyltransferase